MVLLELACGTPPAPRQQTLQDIGLLRHCQQATLSEVMTFIENEKLYGLGCGLVVCHYWPQHYSRLIHKFGH